MAVQRKALSYAPLSTRRSDPTTSDPLGPTPCQRTRTERRPQYRAHPTRTQLPPFVLSRRLGVGPPNGDPLERRHRRQLKPAHLEKVPSGSRHALNISLIVVPGGRSMAAPYRASGTRGVGHSASGSRSSCSRAESSRVGSVWHIAGLTNYLTWASQDAGATWRRVATKGMLAVVTPDGCGVAVGDSLELICGGQVTLRTSPPQLVASADLTGAGGGNDNRVSIKCLARPGRWRVRRSWQSIGCRQPRAVSGANAPVVCRFLRNEPVAKPPLSRAVSRIQRGG
jgi:hypothetical protein